MISLAIIIPTVFKTNYNLLEKTIDSLEKACRNCSKHIKVHIFVWVNSCPDPDEQTKYAQRINTLSNIKTTTLFSGVNLGFCDSNNKCIVSALTLADPDWYMLINDDVVLEQHAIQKLQEWLENNHYDVISGCIYNNKRILESYGLSYFRTGLCFPNRRSYSDPQFSVFAGVLVFLSRKLITSELAKTGYIFNPLFFAYSEDVELSLRIRCKYDIVLLNYGLARHLGSQTLGRGSYKQLFYGYRNLIAIIFLLWSKKSIIKYFPLLVAGQVYIWFMSIYKRHFLLYPAIMVWLLKNFHLILSIRRMYARSYQQM